MYGTIFKRFLGFSSLFLILLTSCLPLISSAATIDHFEIELQSGGAIPTNWTAGIPVAVSITAFQDATTIAIDFNEAASLGCSLDYNPTLKVIQPLSASFTNGVWSGTVTLYRANRYATEDNSISVKYNTTTSEFSPIRIAHNSPAKLAIIEDGGMALYSGLNPAIDPTGTLSVSGQPTVQTAGTAISKIDFFLCDDYWNRITGHADANGIITITCSDSFPAQLLGEGPFVNNTLNVTLTNGVFITSNSFVLYSVNGSIGQTIGVSMGGYSGYELGTHKNAVPVKHASPAIDISSPYNSQNKRFNFIIDPSQPALSAGDATAGVPFAVTIAAVDAYGNTLDSLNGATPFASTAEVSLTAATDLPSNLQRSIWPSKLGHVPSLVWQEGIAYPWIYLFRKTTGNYQHLRVSYDFGAGLRSGTSQYFDVQANTFAQILTQSPGMLPLDAPTGCGMYSFHEQTAKTSPPTDPGVFGSYRISYESYAAGDLLTRLHAYTTDRYGNVVYGIEVDVALTSNDIYAPHPPNQRTDGTRGYADFSNTFVPYTQNSLFISSSTTTVTAFTYSTDYIGVKGGQYYGLQIIAPGLKSIWGSGNSNVAASDYPGIPEGGWYSGSSSVAGSIYEGYPQIAYSYIPVTIKAVDRFGNPCLFGLPRTIELRSDDPDPLAVPNSTTPLTVTLDSDNSRIWFNCRLQSPGRRTLKPYDVTDPSIIDGNDSLTAAYVNIIPYLTHTVTPTGTATTTDTYTPTITVTPLTTGTTITASSTCTPTGTTTTTPTATFSVTSTITAEATTLSASATPTSTGSPTTTVTATITPDTLTPRVTTTSTMVYLITPNQVMAINNLYHPRQSKRPVYINFNQQRAGTVDVKIYSSHGRLIKTLLDNIELNQGYHSLEWYGKNQANQIVSSGVYMVHVQAPGINKILKIVVIK